MTRRDLGKATAGVALAAGLGGLMVCSGGSGTTPTSKEDVLARLPEMSVPKPVDFLRTNWSQDPLSLCSYSYLAPGPWGSGIRSMLAEPVGRIVFAGEATARIPATVHGAIQAGRSAAGDLVERLRRGDRVAVVGAGACGLACADALRAAGLDPVIIEASDRIGGRVKSGTLNGEQVELGASWIHGIEGNPLTELAGRSGVELHPFEYELDFPVPGQGAMGRSGEAAFERSMEAFNPRAPRVREQTVEDLLPRRTGPGLEWAIQTEIGQEYGADPSQLASLATWEGDWLPGGDALLQGSSVDLLAGLADGVEARLDSPVRQISQDGSRVSVSGEQFEVEAAAAVVTVPIGVLKAGTIDFRPGLPAQTQAAIDGLGAGLLDKLWLAFNEPFWDPDTEGFNWISPRNPGRWGSWANMVPVTGEPFLMTLSGGSDARRLARLSDYEVVANAMTGLNEMFG